MQRRLLLDVVVGERAAVLELLAREDQALLVRGNAFLVLDLGLDIVCADASARALWVEQSAVAATGVGMELYAPMVSEDSTSNVIVLPVTRYG